MAGGGRSTPWGVPPMPPGPPGGGKGGRSRFGLLVVAAVVAALVAGVVGGGIGFWAAGDGSDSSTTVSSDSGSEALNRSPDSVAGIAAKALPSVVTIQFRGNGEAGTGTGFVFDKEGHILTNNHVVAAAAKGGKITATFSDGKKYDAEIVGRAQGYDVAVIKLKDAGRSRAEAAAARRLRQGTRRRRDHRDRRPLRPVRHRDDRHHQRQGPPGRLQRRAGQRRART